MKTFSKPKDKKKHLKNLYFYYLRFSYIEGKCYYKHPKYVSQTFGEKFKD